MITPAFAQGNADAKTRADVMDVLNRLNDAYVHENVEQILTIMTPGQDFVQYGTGADEKRVGPTEMRTQVERDVSQADSLRMMFHWTAISAAGDVAWTASDVTMTAAIQGQPLSLPGRMTTVMRKEQGKWRIAQMHLSAPLAT